MKSSLRIIYSLIVFILGIVLLSVLTVLLIYENHQTSLSFDDVSATSNVRHLVVSLRAEIHSTQASTLANLLSNSAIADNNAAVERYIADLDSLIVNNEIQEANLVKLKAMVAQWKDEQVNLAQAGNTIMIDKASLQLHRQTTDAILALLSTMQSIEENTLVEKQAFAKRHSILPAIIGIGVSIFSIIIFILAFYFTNIELKKSNHLNDELELKNKQLEKYTQELSSFTNLTSHDMQEPLRKIELFISLIEDREKETLSPNALQYFNKIKEFAGKMRQLFFGVLSFSLADQVRNIKETVDLNEVLDETLESLKVYIKDTNAVVSNESLPNVHGVKTQLIQLFQNLISNSLKYKRNDVIPEITISYEVVDGKSTMLRELNKDEKYYRVDFRDNGIGFDEQYVDKIFDIFQRHVRTDSSKGIGIGLSICKKIAQNHAGTITAESEINKGSLFSFYVPVAKTH